MTILEYQFQFSMDLAKVTPIAMAQSTTVREYIYE